MGMTGSPAFSEQLRKLERDRAQQASNIASQFGLAAAGQDEVIRRGRLQALSQALAGERGAVRDEMAFQTDLARQAQADYDRYLAQQQAGYLQPTTYADEGLRLALGGIGSSLQPAIGASLASLGGIMNTANQQMSNNQMLLSGAFGGGGRQGQYGLWS